MTRCRSKSLRCEASQTPLSLSLVPHISGKVQTMGPTEEMRRLVAKLQEDRAVRVADVADMQDLTAAFLGDVRTEQIAVAEAMREEMAAERVKRSDERDQMAMATATFRADVRTQHQMVSATAQQPEAPARADRTAGGEDGGRNGCLPHQRDCRQCQHGQAGSRTDGRRPPESDCDDRGSSAKRRRRPGRYERKLAVLEASCMQTEPASCAR